MKSLTGITVLLLILSACLHGYPVKELSSWFKKLNKINCKKAVQLYTPEKVEDGCLREAMECFGEGLDTFSSKCSEDLEQEDGWDTIENLYMFLNHTAGQMKISERTERCACKENQKMPFQNFRAQLILLIKKVNSQS